MAGLTKAVGGGGGGGDAGEDAWQLARKVFLYISSGMNKIEANAREAHIGYDGDADDFSEVGAVGHLFLS